MSKNELKKIILFEPDKEGNIFIFDGSRIYKFDPNGNCLKKFKEIERKKYDVAFTPKRLRISKGNIIQLTEVSSLGEFKIYYFGMDGNLINIKNIEINSKRNVNNEHWILEDGMQLENGNYLLVRQNIRPKEDHFSSIIYLFNSELDVIRELDKREYENPLLQNKIRAIYNNYIFEVGDNKIITGNQGEDYCIKIYDLNGVLKKKIIKEYIKVSPNEKYKKEYMENFRAPIFDIIRDKFYFPDYLPAYHSFISDDNGRLFVMTYEKDSNNGYIFDIINPDGVFICRKGIKDFSTSDRLIGKIKNNKLFCIHKDNPHKLFVYKLKWI